MGMCGWRSTTRGSNSSLASSQLHCNLIIQNLFHGQRNDHSSRLFEKPLYLGKRVAGVVERHEEPFHSLLANHRSLERIDVRPSRLVLLLYLDRVPHVHKVERIGFHRWRCGKWIEPSVQPHVAYLHLVGNASQCLSLIHISEP